MTFEGIFAPKDAPEWARDRERLWSEVEKAETRKNSQLAREVQIALPHELTEEQRQQLLTDFVRENFVRKGMVADVAIHAPDREGDDRNHHAHVLLTMREIGPNGFGAKLRELNSKGQLETWRENWARTANRYLERHGHEARIDHRSLAEQGIDREPTTHNGPTATQMEREGEASERGDINREIEARNRERERLEIAARAVGRELTELAPEEGKAVHVNDPQQPERRKSDHRKKAEAALNAFANWTENGKDFLALAEEKGFLFAAHKQAVVVALDKWGSVYSLKKIAGEKVADIDREALPTVEQAKGIQNDRRERRAAVSLEKSYDRGGMVAQQQAAMGHHQQRQKTLNQTNKQQEREKDAFANRKDQGQQKREDKAARTEQTEATRRAAQKEAMKEIFETKFGKGHNANDRESWERERGGRER